MGTHAQNAEKFLTDQERAAWFNRSIWYQRDKRDAQSKSIQNWEELRDLASRIKAHTLANLAAYLEEFAAKAEANGVQIHWAEDADAHNRIVYDILKRHNATMVVKSKSMLTEECGLNPFLEKRGIEVVDTDLGERIIQFAGEKPSHIVMPAIHKKREEVGQIFEKHLGTPLSGDPVFLTGEARKHLRQKFLSADAALSGVNFAIAETGSIVICTNEGNADLGINARAGVHIASMGIEKIVPKAEHLGVFTRMLARNATGQPITTYTSHYTRPAQGKEMHVVIVDNNRSKILNHPDFYEALKCIRCAACMNTCPVFRNSGGHSYNFVIPGPIGSVLAPMYDIKQYRDMPFASTLCGSCANVCPVRIPLDRQLYRWRQIIGKSIGKKFILASAGKILSSPVLLSVFESISSFLIKNFSSFARALTPWGRSRELPQIPEMTFKQWYKKNGQFKR